MSFSDDRKIFKYAVCAVFLLETAQTAMIGHDAYGAFAKGFGDMTVLLQVHVIKDPAYDLLLGRPFDTLMQTNVQNLEDGGMLITLTDPVTKRRVTVPTFVRGATILENSAQKEKQAEEKPKPVAQGFLITSRN